VFGRKGAAAKQTPIGQQGVQQQGPAKSKQQQHAAAQQAAAESAGGCKVTCNLSSALSWHKCGMLNFPTEYSAKDCVVCYHLLVLLKYVAQRLYVF
jgi:hypothetical protein